MGHPLERAPEPWRGWAQRGDGRASPRRGRPRSAPVPPAISGDRGRLGALAPLALLGSLVFGCGGCAGERPLSASQRPYRPPSSPAQWPEPRHPVSPAAVLEYALGPLPEGVVPRLPEAPVIEREVVVRSDAEARAAARRPRTRLLVRADLGRLDVAADDIELEIDDGVTVEQLFIERGRARVRVSGGRFAAIELAVPAQHVPPPPRWRNEWMVSDVLFDGVQVVADETAFAIRGRRVAVLRSRTSAGHYSVWCGDTAELQSEDIVLAGNRFRSAGPESTVRLVGVRGAIVVDNVLENSNKHDFRVHGRSAGVVFARNRLLNTGIMIGSMPGDRVDAVWLLDNELYHRTPSLLEAPPAAVSHLVVRGNRVFSDQRDCLVCGRVPSTWDVADNPVAPHREPPPD